MRSLLAVAACAVALVAGSHSASASAFVEETLVPGTPAGAFPYTFPYCPDTRCIVSDFELQEMRLYEGETVLKRMKMSSAAFGIGFQMDAGGRSPSGKFEVSMKVGGHLQKYAIIEKLTPTGQLGYPTLSGPAYMTSRILVLNGLDKTPNYDNTNTLYRHVYIHGTNREARLGQRASEGCFRISNDDSIELFNMIDTGIHYYAVPNNAWPAESNVAALPPIDLSQVVQEQAEEVTSPHPMRPSECTSRCGDSRESCYKWADGFASQTPAGRALFVKLINNCNLQYNQCTVVCQFLPPGPTVAVSGQVGPSQVVEEVASPHPMRPSECVGRCGDSRESCYKWADGFASQTPAGRVLFGKLINNCNLQYNQCSVVCQSLPPGPSVAVSGPKSRLHKMLGQA